MTEMCQRKKSIQFRACLVESITVCVSEVFLKMWFVPCITEPKQRK